jgi:hypothetical protein
MILLFYGRVKIMTNKFLLKIIIFKPIYRVFKV